MDNGTLTASDVALLSRDNGFDSCWGGNSMMWIFALLILAGGGFGGFGGWGNNAAAALGYENLATSAEVQRGFDTQNLQAQTRDILAAVNAGTAQSVATTNQVYHDTVNALNDKYSELARDVAGLAVGQANTLATINDCCCGTKMLIAETASQSRYDNAMNTAAINANTTAQTQRILDAIAQDKIEALQGKINALELQQAVAGVVRYPMATTYTSGCNPFCGCNCNI